MAFQLALGCNTVGYYSLHRTCCTCVTNTDAMEILLEKMGLSTITASGGAVVATPTSDYKQLTCAPTYPDGSTDPDYPAFDFSASTSTAITTSPSGAGYFACPPNFASGEDPRGALEHACVSNSLNSRGFCYRTRILGDGSCPSYLGSNTLDYFATFQTSVVFVCESGGVSKYNLYANASLILYTQNPTGYFASLPTTGTDWTRVDSTGQSVFTKNGSTDDEGAAVAVVHIRNITSGTVYELTASAWTVNPNTTVSLWTPDPVIDWTGLTHSGTATLS